MNYSCCRKFAISDVFEKKASAPLFLTQTYFTVTQQHNKIFIMWKSGCSRGSISHHVALLLQMFWVFSVRLSAHALVSVNHYCPLVFSVDIHISALLSVCYVCPEIQLCLSLMIFFCLSAVSKNNCK